MWCVTSGGGVEHARGHHREHAVDVAEHVGVAAAQRERLQPQQAHVDLGPLGVDADALDGAAGAREPDRALEHPRVADGVDADVDAAPFGAAAHGRPGVLLGEVHRLGAEGLGDRQALGNGVDRVDVGGAARRARPAPRTAPPGRARARRRRRRGAGRSRRRRESRCPSRRPRTARRRRSCPRARAAGRGRRSGSSAMSACVPCSDPSVEPWPNVRECQAAVVEAAAAEEAVAAGGLKAAEDPVADGEALDAVAGGDDRADVLVADREALLDLHAAVVDVQVRAADAGGLDRGRSRPWGRSARARDAPRRDDAGGLEGDGSHRRGSLPVGRRGLHLATTSRSGPSRGRTRSP